MEEVSGKGEAVMWLDPCFSRRLVTIWLTVAAVELGCKVRASWKRVCMSVGLKM